MRTFLILAISVLTCCSESISSLQVEVDTTPYVSISRGRRHVRSLWIEEIKDDGEFLELSDGSLWQINPNDRFITDDWNEDRRVYINSRNRSKWPYTITNWHTGETVKARRVRSID